MIVMLISRCLHSRAINTDRSLAKQWRHCMRYSLSVSELPGLESYLFSDFIFLLLCTLGDGMVSFSTCALCSKFTEKGDYNTVKKGVMNTVRIDEDNSEDAF